MSRNKRNSKAISWTDAFRVGFSIAVNYKIFTFIAVFVILCERYISFYLYFSNVSLTKVFSQYKEMMTAMSRDPLGNSWAVTQFKELISFFPLALLLFLIGAFFLIGILGLMRDLLIKRSFKVKKIFHRGRDYFWPVLRFKILIYFILTSIFIILALPIFDKPIKPSPYLFVSILIMGVIFFCARIFLSLGPKIIVTEEEKKIFPLYKRILKLIYPYLKSVIIFYVWMLAMVCIGLFIPFGLKLAGISFVPLMMISIFTIAFFTVVMKASAFNFYLQLSSDQVEIWSVKSNKLSGLIKQIDRGDNG